MSRPSTNILEGFLARIRQNSRHSPREIFSKGFRVYSFASVLVFGSVRVALAALITLALRSTWRATFPAYTLAAAIVEIIYAMVVIAKRDVRVSHFWVLSLLTLSTLGSSVAAYVLGYLWDPALRGILAVFLGANVLYFCERTLWATRFWRKPSMRLYAPVRSEEGDGVLNHEHSAANSWALEKLYQRVFPTLQPGSEIPAITAVTETEESRSMFHLKQPSGLLGPAIVPDGPDFWLFNSYPTVRWPWLKFHLVFLLFLSMVHTAYQLFQYVYIKQNHQECEWRCTYNIVYIWVYFPWVVIIAWMIKRPLSLSQRIVRRTTVAQLLAIYFALAWLLWAFAVYTTIMQPGGFVSRSVVGKVLWYLTHACNCMILLLLGIEFALRAFERQDR
ncbi:hypothetical protein CC86DRAFT_373120 [Ophiobolus disseminans]|uniref:Uncharacterized protein n=1 Tax=Ophiobolus disseminans TaxID=1469910 RepID=A0A6A6ZQG4_9PLEO|nr:hypothetical protein CC86DRAFT_373120 [Ophiobolus disseminans]